MTPRWIAPGLAVGFLCLVPPALGHDMQMPREAEQHRHENGEGMAQHDNALKLALTYASDIDSLAGNPSSNVQYLHRVGLIADIDLDRAIGWRGGSAHLSIHAIQGRGLSQNVLHNILPVSGLEAEPALRLFNLWVEQKIGTGSVRVGQFTAGQEFAISANAALFVNATFGWPASFAADLPSGGPAYPLAAPGIRLAARISPRASARIAIFAGDPAGSGEGDPQRRDLHGLNGFRLQGRPFIIAEFERSSAPTDPQWTLRAGAWVHMGNFADQSLAVGSPNRELRGNFTVYGIADARLWRSDTTHRTLQAFMRVSASLADRNLVDVYADAGLTLAGPLTTRQNDIVGIALGFAHVTPSAPGAVASQPGTPTWAGVLEVSYRVTLSPTISIQPFGQRLFNAAAGVDEAGGLVPCPGDATVFGLRTTARF